MARTDSWLLINYTSPRSLAIYPLGMAYISAALKADGRFTVHCLDLATVPAARHHDLVAERLGETGAGVVGIGGFSNDFSALKAIIGHIRQTHPHVVVVGGGHIVSADPLFIHDKMDLDYGVHGEGEETVVEVAAMLAEGGSPEGILGVVYHGADGKSVMTPERKPGNDIDDIPWPDWDGFDLAGYIDRQDFASETVFNTHLDRPRSAPILLSRSCPYKCTFCSHSISRFRSRDLDAVFAEIDALVARFGINALSVNDDLFAVKRSRVSEFCQRIKPYNLPWSAQVRVDLAQPDLLEELAESSCVTISYGFESMSAPVLDSMKKKIKPEQIEVAAKRTYDAHLSIQGNFIFGDTAETLDSADETINWWADHRQYSIHLTPILIYPGTALYSAAMAKGLIGDPEQYISIGFPIVNCSNIPPEDYIPFVRESGAAGTLTLPAQITDLGHSEEPRRFKVGVICPHCGEEQHYGRVPTSRVYAMCRSCRARFDIPLPRRLGRALFPEANTEKLTQARALFDQGRYDKCAAAAQQVIAETAYDYDALAALGVSQVLMGRFTEAKTALRRALDIETTLPDVQNNYGVALCAEGQLGWGLLRFQQALVIDPNHAGARANLDLLRNWLGERYDRVPFARRITDFPHAGLMHLSKPSITQQAVVARWPALRGETNHPFAAPLLPRRSLVDA